MKLLIKNGYIITADAKGTVFENGVVRIDGGQITYVGKDDGAAFDADRVIDAAGDIVMPAFHNTHTHLSMTLLRGCGEDQHLLDWLKNTIDPLEARLDGNAAYWGAMLALVEMARTGCVSVSDMYMFTADVARAIEQSGMKGLITRGTLGKTVAEGASRLAEMEALFELLPADGRLKPAYSLYTEYTCGDELIAEVVSRARARGARIHAHVSESRWEHEDCLARRGMTPIAAFEALGALDVPFMAAHCVHITEEDMDILAAHGASVLSCPRSNLKLANGVAPLAKLLEHGVNVGFGTDGAASNNAQNILLELQLAAFLQKGVFADSELLPAATAIRMATRGGALALGLDDSGELSAGFRADMQIINTTDTRFFPRENLPHHVLYTAVPTDTRLTMVEGEIIFENGRVAFCDEAEVLAKCAEQYKKMHE